MFSDSRLCRFRVPNEKKAISRVLNPADGLGSLRLPEASDGAGYDDHNNPYYSDRRANSAAREAEGHCQKLQCTPKFRKCKRLILSEKFMPRFGLCRLGSFLLLVEYRVQHVAHCVA